MDNTENTSNSYQIIVCNIMWSDPKSRGRHDKLESEELPDSMTLDVPENVLKHARKNGSEFELIIEQFAYNTLYRKYKREIHFAQVFLPLGENI